MHGYCLDGLSVGDAFGERFFLPPEQAYERIARRDLPEAPWTYTDDTEMALSIVEILQERGSIDQNLLASRFAGRMQPHRGYGRGAYTVLWGVKQGLHWRTASNMAFRGKGSFGNGAAMRVAPLGAFTRWSDPPSNTRAPALVGGIGVRPGGLLGSHKSLKGRVSP